jgi:peptide/nickel transport system substrate-binding protein
MSHSRTSRRSIIKAAGGLGALAMAPALSQHSALAQAAETPVEGGTLTYGVGKLSTNIISPLNTIGTAQNTVIDALFLRLVYGRQWGDGLNPQETGDIELGVAETMTEITPNQVWEFTLRQNCFWHDGQPVTADDLIFGVWLSLHPDAGTSSETPVIALKGAKKLQAEGGTEVAIEGITKLGDYAVRIELERPIPNYWVNWGVGYWPYPKHIFGGKPFADLFAEPYATMPIGNGPFKATKYVDGQYMEMDANPDFYAGKPHLDKFIVRFGDADTLTAAVEAEEILGLSVSAGAVYDRLSTLENLTGNAVPRDHPDGFVVNVERHPGHAAGLTKAIMHALDIPTINEQLYSGTLRPSNYLFEHVVGLETPPAGFPTYEYDPGKSAAILTEIGWDANKELEWLVSGTPTTIQDAILAMLGQAGIKVKYKQIDPATVIDELYTNGNYDLFFGNFGPGQDMEYNWRYIKTGWTYETGGFNYARYANAEVDALWQQALDEPDAAAQKALWDQVSLKLGENPPQATMYRQSITYVWNKKVRGAYPYQYRLPVRPVFEKVWLAAE